MRGFIKEDSDQQLFGWEKIGDSYEFRVLCDSMYGRIYYIDRFYISDCFFFGDNKPIYRDNIKKYGHNKFPVQLGGYCCDLHLKSNTEDAEGFGRYCDVSVSSPAKGVIYAPIDIKFVISGGWVSLNKGDVLLRLDATIGAYDSFILGKEKEEIAAKIKEKYRRRELEKLVRQELIDSGELFGDKPKRPPIPREIVDAVYRRDGGRCVYCGATENLQLDHIIPFSKGGATSLEHLQLLCQKCNLEKSNKIG